MLDALKASSKKAEEGYPDEYDLLIVGGGATGAGVAVDAASRGLKVALVERDDFSSGVHAVYYLDAMGDVLAERAGLASGAGLLLRNNIGVRSRA